MKVDVRAEIRLENRNESLPVRDAFFEKARDRLVNPRSDTNDARNGMKRLVCTRRESLPLYSIGNYSKIRRAVYARGAPLPIRTKLANARLSRAIQRGEKQ